MKELWTMSITMASSDSPVWVTSYEMVSMTLCDLNWEVNNIPSLFTSYAVDIHIILQGYVRFCLENLAAWKLE